MYRALIFLPALLALPLAGCIVGVANGQPYSESMRHTYANFKRVDVSAGVEAVVSQGAYDVKAETTRGEGFDQLVVEVRGDTLFISRKQNIMNWGGPDYRVTVSAPAYEAFEASSGSRLEAASSLQLADVRASVSSGASMELRGACNAIDVDISSGASFSGEELRCASARVDASSGASANVFASQLADGDASSGASVTFHGKPAQFHEDSSSGGSVSAR